MASFLPGAGHFHMRFGYRRGNLNLRRWGMLTLTRRLGESIVIGDEGVEIIVKEIRRGQVRLSIVAPKKVKVYRKEIYEDIYSMSDKLPPKGS